ncbi:MAG: hypothetical protein KA746_13750 [Pyrinomonadaceae bacterium]|nr:hypothetical protein [Pyrinomonadaceae bacterium]MBP6211756.1 hypothetical protein [Pyrinomonadaceae bacterium]
MKKLIILTLLITASLILSAVGVFGQENRRTTFTGTVVSYGSGFNTRTTTSNFTLNLTDITSDDDAKRYLGILQDEGQDKLLDAIRSTDLGNFAVGGRVGRTVNGVRVSEVDGKQRIRIIFERWLGVAELRGGYRSIDYPFGYIELLVDPVTGKGDGTYIAAAKIRVRTDKKTGQEQVEVEDFATFPSKLMGVVVRGRKLL